MVPRGYINGNEIFFDYITNKWYYTNNGVPISKCIRPCPHCGKMPSKEGYDACTGHLRFTQAYCCGHGIPNEQYRYWKHQYWFTKYIRMPIGILIYNRDLFKKQYLGVLFKSKE